MGSLEIAEEIKDDVDLPGRAEEARTDAVKGQAVLLPALDIRRHVVRIVVEIIVVEARMDRQDGCRQNAALDLQGRHDGQGHGNAAAAIAGHIIDQSQFLLMHIQSFLIFSGYNHNQGI